MALKSRKASDIMAALQKKFYPDHDEVIEEGEEEYNTEADPDKSDS